jgi:hypothetical protein
MFHKKIFLIFLSFLFVAQIQTSESSKFRKQLIHANEVSLLVNLLGGEVGIFNSRDSRETKNWKNFVWYAPWAIHALCDESDVTNAMILSMTAAQAGFAVRDVYKAVNRSCKE